jgi:hypothetical protein
VTIPFRRAGWLPGMRGVHRGEALGLIAYRDASTLRLKFRPTFRTIALEKRSSARTTRAYS